MRIIAGTLGGRHINSPHGHRTHPMSDKMRGALFNSLGDLSGLTVLDAFAGSGALSFEAISRGAATVTAIESDRLAQMTIDENIRTLELGKRVKHIKARVQAWLTTTTDKFDIVIADPPYDHTQLPVLQKLATRVKPGGLLVVSLPPKTELTDPADCSVVQYKDYGDGSLRFYRRLT